MKTATCTLALKQSILHEKQRYLYKIIIAKVELKLIMSQVHMYKYLINYNNSFFTCTIVSHMIEIIKLKSNAD